MEYLPGGSLGQQTCKEMPEERAARAVNRLLAAVEYVHSKVCSQNYYADVHLPLKRETYRYFQKGVGGPLKGPTPYIIIAQNPTGVGMRKFGDETIAEGSTEQVAPYRPQGRPQGWGWKLKHYPHPYSLPRGIKQKCRGK